MPEIDGFFYFVFATTANGVRSAPDSVPTATVYGQDSSDPLSGLENIEATGPINGTDYLYRLAIPTTIANGFEAGGQYPLDVSWTVDDVSYGLVENFPVV
jgi:hypothetical protein